MDDSEAALAGRETGGQGDGEDGELVIEVLEGG
jgi:hypothetical protein